MEPIIRITEVNKTFKNQKVLNNINIDFEKGKIHGIIGRNGSGKTVLIKILCGFMLPDTGEVTVSGKRIGKDVDFPQNVGAIVENPGFLPTQNGYKNLEYLASLRNKIGRMEIASAMQTVGLDPNDKKHEGKYSLGMKQRLALAQAIMENPDILILDEPMNGLDNEGVADMRKYILGFKKQGKTVLLISHNMEDITHLCDTVHEMDKGNLTDITKSKMVALEPYSE